MATLFLRIHLSGQQCVLLRGAVISRFHPNKCWLIITIIKHYYRRERWSLFSHHQLHIVAACLHYQHATNDVLKTRQAVAIVWLPYSCVILFITNYCCTFDICELVQGKMEIWRQENNAIDNASKLNLFIQLEFVWVNVTISSCSALARQRRGFSHNLFFPQSAQEPHQSPASGWWRQSSSSSSSSSSWRPCLWIWTATRQFLDNWTLNSRFLLTRMWNCLCLWNSRLKPQQQFTFHSYKLSLAISNAGV